MKYRVTVYTLTPLHIGTGDVLLRNYDFATGADRTYVLDQDAVLAREYEHTGKVPEKPAGQLIISDELQDDAPFVRYSLAGTTTVDEIREQIKDVRGQCYLPGSSLKGALRTVVMAHAVRAQAFQPELSRLGNDKSWAARDWERAALGRDETHDLLRALQVADSEPLPRSPSPLRLAHAQVFTGGEPSAPIWVEAIRAETPFTTHIKVDESLILGDYANRLGWADRAGWLTQLPALAQRLAREHISHERDIAREKDLGDAEKFYDQLLNLKLGDNQFLLHLSWGAGWNAKTVGDLLSEEVMWEVRRRYALGQPPTARGRWEPKREQAFPRSRRLLVKRGNNAEAEPGVPLGWVRIAVEPMSEASKEWSALADKTLSELKPELDAPLPVRSTLISITPARPAPQPGAPPARPAPPAAPVNNLDFEPSDEAKKIKALLEKRAAEREAEEERKRQAREEKKKKRR
jgi:CRISPR type III-A-associated RAMP protein Csm5